MKLLLVNPRRKSTVAKKGETMRKRHTRKHTAKRVHVRRRKNPRAVATVAASPVARHSRRRRIGRSLSVASRRIRRRAKGFGSSSAKSLVASSKQTVMHGAIAGLGAVGADIVAGQLMKYLPASLKTAEMQPFAQVGVSLLAGFVISKVHKQAGDAVAFGGVTVATYNLAKSLLNKAGVPGLSGYNNLQGYDYNPSYGIGLYDPGLRSVGGNPLAEYTDNPYNLNGGMLQQNTFGMGMYDNTYGAVN